MNKIKSRSIAIGAGLGLVTMAGVSFAAFTATSSFTVDGATAQLAPVSIDADIVGQMWPGQLNDVNVSIYNPNPVDVRITHVNYAGVMTGITAAEGDGNPSKMDALNTTVIPAGQTVGPITVKEVVGLKASADNKAAGKAVQIKMTADIATAAK